MILIEQRLMSGSLKRWEARDAADALARIEEEWAFRGGIEAVFPETYSDYTAGLTTDDELLFEAVTHDVHWGSVTPIAS